MRSFASDNNAGAHPKIIEAIQRVNRDHVLGYGDDLYTKSAVDQFRKHFGNAVEVFFVFNGTAANVLGLSAVLRSFEAIICAHTAHIHEDECGAPEKFLGSQLITIETDDGKLSPQKIIPHIRGVGVEHHVQPRVISITQSTELGTLYTYDEIKSLADFAHSHSMYLHMDGARISNAAAALQLPLAKLTTEAGVDLLSFGGTKNGLILGDAVVFLNPELSKNFKFIRKQGMQLGSKMRFISAQFEAIFHEDLWLQNAKHSNSMAKLLEAEVRKISGVEILRPVVVNSVFARIPKSAIAKLQAEFFFYVWNEANNEVRWMTSFDTTQEDILRFCDSLRKAISH